ncbi:MAG: hypothetical protein RLZZ337_1021 [Bacteroidota bacterium]|jgi:hypothetical protein
MKFFILAICFFIFSSIEAQTTQYLILKHKEKSNEIALAEGSVIVIQLNNGEKLRGELLLKSESYIQLKNRQIPLSNIAAIGRKNQGVHRIAALIVTNGMNVFLFGMNDNLLNGWDKISNAHKASLPMLATGIPLLTITYKRKMKKWDLLPVLKDW